MKRTGRQSSNVQDEPWLQQMTPQEQAGIATSPFSGFGVQLQGPSWKDMLYLLLSGAGLPIENPNVPNLGQTGPEGMMPMDVEAIAAKLQGLPYGGMGFKGDMAVEASRAMNSNSEMAADRSRPWAENSSAGTMFMMPGGKPEITGSQLQRPTATSDGRRPMHDVDGWKRMERVPEFDPQWIQPGRTNPQPSFAEMLRGLLGG